MTKESTPFLDKYRAREKRSELQRDRVVWQGARPNGMGSDGSPNSGSVWRAAARMVRAVP